MILKLVVFAFAALLVLLTIQRIRMRDFSTVTAVLGGILGYFIGSSMGITMFGDAMSGVWVMPPLLFVLGGMIHITDRRS